MVQGWHGSKNLTVKGPTHCRSDLAHFHHSSNVVHFGEVEALHAKEAKENIKALAELLQAKGRKGLVVGMERWKSCKQRT
eukprot:scaffold59806_cov12-Tisochrysis_lutea.AAC.1